MGIQAAEIMGSRRKEWAFECTWCVQGMQSNPKGQEHRVLVWEPQGRRNQEMELALGGSGCEGSCSSKSMYGRHLSSLTMKGKLLVTSNLSVSMHSLLHKKLFKPEGPCLCSHLSNEQCPGHSCVQGLGLWVRLHKLYLEKGWGLDVGGSQRQSIGYNQKSGWTHLLMVLALLVISEKRSLVRRTVTKVDKQSLLMFGL